MTSFKSLFADMSTTTNNLFGEVCALHITDPYEDDLLLPSIQVIVDKSKPVKGDFNNIVGYRIAAKILMTDLDRPPRHLALLRTEDGTIYELGEVVEQNKTSWWFDCMSTSELFPV